MENREELLTRLYGIRAGISAISVEKDKLASVQSKIDGYNNAITEQRNKIDENERKYLCEIETEQSHLRYLDYKLKEKEEELATAIANKSKSLWQCLKEVSGDFFIGFMICVFLFAACLTAFAIFLFLLFKYPNSAQIHGPLMPISLCIGFIPSVIMFSRLKKYIPTILDMKMPGTRIITNEIEEIKKEIQCDREKIEELNKAMCVENAPELVCLNLKKDEAAVTVPGLKANVKIIRSYADNLYNILVKEYSSFLAPSDWHQLDYIIYLFETGRADSIKESLQLLDEMKRHVELMQVMNHISQTIRTGFNVLNSNMLNCFSTMSNQLDTLSDQISSANNAQTKLLDKIDFHSAMLSKANETSEKMMNDIEYIKKSHF